jgi:hypothetical protein
VMPLHSRALTRTTAGATRPASAASRLTLLQTWAP